MILLSQHVVSLFDVAILRFFVHVQDLVVIYFRIKVLLFIVKGTASVMAKIVGGSWKIPLMKFLVMIHDSSMSKHHLTPAD